MQPQDASDTARTALKAPAEQAPRPAVPNTTPEQLQRVQAALLPPLALEMPGMRAAAKNERVPRFDFRVREAPLREVFQALLAGTSYQLTLPAEVKGVVTADLRGVTVEEALLAIGDAHGYEVMFEANRVVVAPDALRTRIFQVNYPTTSGRNDFWAQLGPNLRAVVGQGPGRDVSLNSAAGVAMVRGMAAELRQVERYLAAAHASLQRQVVLEAKFIEVGLSDRFREGVDWSAITAAPGGRFAGVDLLGFPTSAGDFDALLTRLAAQGAVRVLSSLRFTTLNNQRALLRVGEGGLAGGVAGGVAPGANRDPFSGVELTLTPQISGDARLILRVQPALNSPNGSNDVRSVAQADSVIHAENGTIAVISGMSNFGAPRQGRPRELVILVKPTVVSGAANDFDGLPLDAGARQASTDLEFGSRAR